MTQEIGEILLLGVVTLAGLAGIAAVLYVIYAGFFASIVILSRYLDTFPVTYRKSGRDYIINYRDKEKRALHFTIFVGSIVVGVVVLLLTLYVLGSIAAIAGVEVSTSS